MANLVLATCLIAVTVAAPTPKSEGPRVVSNPGKDIHLVSDRKETVREFFNRTHVVVGSVLVAKGPAEMPGLENLLEATETLKVFASHPAPNDAENPMLFGEHFSVAPPSAAVVELLKKAKGEDKVSLILAREKDGTYRLVGYTTRGQVDFFGSKAIHLEDGFSPADLRFVEPKK